MRANEFITNLSESHDAVMYKARYMAHRGGGDGKMVRFNYPGTLGRQLVAFTKKNGTWVPSHEEAEQYLDMFLDIIHNEPELIAESAKKKKLRKSARAAIPGMRTIPALNNNNDPYLAYRFGVALATSPDGDMDKETDIGSNFTMIDYSEADGNIRNHAEKVMGVKSKKETSNGSSELDVINKTSPVAKKKTNKYGV